MIAAFTGSSSVSVTITMWYCTNASVPVLPDTFFTGLDANGVPTGVIGGWFQVPRDSLGTPLIPLVTSYTGYPESGWYLNDETAALASKFFAIVIGTTAMPITSSLGFKSVSLQSGDIPTIPAPQTPGEVVFDCQYYYQKSFLKNIVPVVAAGANSGESFGVQYTAPGLPSAGPFIRFPTQMRGTPNIVLYNPINANSEITTPGIGDWSGSTPANISANGFFPVGIPNAGSLVGELAIINWTADARLGVV